MKMLADPMTSDNEANNHLDFGLPPEEPRYLVQDTPVVVKDLPRKRLISTGQLVLFTYFITSGSPFGIESAVLAGGPLFTILGCVVIILVWALPQALVSAELSTMMNENGGSVIWVQHAFGDFIGFINAHANLLCLMTSQSILLKLFVTYIGVEVPFGYWQEIVVSLLFVVLVCNINLIGVDWISKLSMLFFIFLFSPFFAELFFMIYHRDPVHWNSLIEIPPLADIQWGLLISTLVWSNGGYDFVGGMAGEVKNTKSFLLGVLGAVPIGLLNYVFPLIIGYLRFPFYAQWNSQSFAWIAIHKFPYFIGIWMICATGVSSFAPFNNVTAALSRMVWAMAVGRQGGMAEHRYLPYFLSWSYQKPNGESVPVAAIILCCLVPFGISLLPTSFILQLFLVLRLVTIYLEYLSCIYLRWKKPDANRPFKVPGGIIGCVLLSLPTFAISIWALATSDKEVLIYGGSTLAVVVLSYGVKVFWVWVTHKYDCCLSTNPELHSLAPA